MQALVTDHDGAMQIDRHLRRASPAWSLHRESTITRIWGRQRRAGRTLSPTVQWITQEVGHWLRVIQREVNGEAS